MILKNKEKNRAKSKNGQIAMEYLITYGWALMTILVVMVILYSTIFKPEFYIAERCEMAPGLECRPETTILKKVEGAEGGAKLTMQLTNIMGYDIILDKIEFTPIDLIEGGEKTYVIDCGTPGSINSTCASCSPSCSPSGFTNRLTTIQNGENKIIDIFIYGDPSRVEINKLYKIKFALNYTIAETGTQHRTAGIINVRAS